MGSKRFVSAIEMGGTGCSQEDDQLLREGRGWSCASGRKDRFHTPRAGRLGQGTSPTPDDGHGSDDPHRMDLRSPASAGGKGEGGTSADAAGDRRGEEEERQDRCRQDRRLPALRLPAGVPHDFDRDPGAALPEPGAEADGSDEEPGIGLLMETRVSYNKQRLHKLGYFTELMSGNNQVNENIEQR